MATINAPGSIIYNNGPVIIPQPSPQPSAPPPRPGFAVVPLGCVVWSIATGKPIGGRLKSFDAEQETLVIEDPDTGADVTIDTKVTRAYINAPNATINVFEAGSYGNYNNINVPWGGSVNVYERRHIYSSEVTNLIDFTLPLRAVFDWVK